MHVAHATAETHARPFRVREVELTSEGGPDLAGSIVVDGPPPAQPQWDRFTIDFEDGGRLALRDKRRLGRAVLDPDWEHLGPDAAVVGRDAFRARVGRGGAQLKARLMDQSVIAGVGNLLAVIRVRRTEPRWRRLHERHASAPGGRRSWTVIGLGGEVVEPVERFLALVRGAP